jgi:exodeoxyribonuclease V alpha subunit
LDQITARLTDKTHLFLVGDVDQLPSVGPGAALQDLIAAREEAQVKGLHVARLTRIFRQEAGNRSMIVVNCHRVRRGERPLTDVPKDSDYYEMLRDTPEQARELAVSLATERLPRYLQVEPNEVQVLAPMHSGEAGIRALNRALQATLNPPAVGKPEMAHGEGGIPLRLGDKVRQTRNDYQKQVFNGDLGVVTALDPETRSVTVTFDEIMATYASDELDDLTHSWAMTVHAAQGSQWPAVVIIMLTSHYVMLERNILYTALSRAQRLAVLITQEQAVRMAVAQDRATRRRTGLTRRLAEGR